jgi:hypothetical protein
MWKRVRTIKPVGTGVYYDLTVPRWANYVAEGTVHHNSGKSWTAEMLFGKMAGNLGSSFGLKTLSVDEIFELRAKQMGMSLKTAFLVPTETPAFASKGHEVHNAAWYTMMNQRSHLGRGRLGLLIDGTAKDPAYILRGKKALEDLGYDCSLVMVTTPLEVARQRNQSRGRMVPDSELVASHEAVARSAKALKSKFGERYYEVENREPYDTQSREFRTEIEPAFHRFAMKILAKPLTNPKGKAWVAQQLEGAPDHLKKKVWQGLGVRWHPSAVDKLGKLGRRALKTT